MSRSGTTLYLHRVLRPGEAVGPVGPDAGNAFSEAGFRGLLESLNGRLVDWDRSVQPDTPTSGSGVALSFDDGFRDFREVALPYLEEYGKKVLLFVTTGFASHEVTPYEYRLAHLIERHHPIALSRRLSRRCHVQQGPSEVYACLTRVLKALSPRRRERELEQLFTANGLALEGASGPALLNWEELRELAQHPLVDIGAHSVAHPVLPRLAWHAAWQEIRDSKTQLEARLGVPVKAFAYPYGAHSRATRRMVRRAGFNWGFATEQGDWGDPFRVPRLNARTWSE